MQKPDQEWVPIAAATVLGAVLILTAIAFVTKDRFCAGSPEENAVICTRQWLIAIGPLLALLAAAIAVIPVWRQLRLQTRKDLMEIRHYASTERELAQRWVDLSVQIENLSQLATPRGIAAHLEPALTRGDQVVAETREIQQQILELQNRMAFARDDDTVRPPVIERQRFAVLARANEVRRVLRQVELVEQRRNLHRLYSMTMGIMPEDAAMAPFLNEMQAALEPLTAIAEALHIDSENYLTEAREHETALQREIRSYTSGLFRR